MNHMNWMLRKIRRLTDGERSPYFKNKGEAYAFMRHVSKAPLADNSRLKKALKARIETARNEREVA